MKRDKYLAALSRRLDDVDALERYLLEHSGLPGPRADLELIGAFAATIAAGVPAAVRQKVDTWAALPVDEAPTNHPRELLVAAAIVALGACYGGAAAEARAAILASLRRAANDSRWRTREAAAMALQLIGETDFSLLQQIVTAWLADATLLEQRAVIAALAHPPILADPAVAAFALEIAASIVTSLPRAGEAEASRALHKALAYALSVFTAAAPQQGFRLLARLARSDRLEIKKIVAANLRKTRLAKRFPEECAEVGEELASGD